MHRAIGERDVAETAVTEAEAVDLYREMVRARQFDDRALALQRRGWMSGYPPFRGQEATQVGVAHAMEATDWLVPTYRSNAAQIARGVPMSDLFAFRKGYAEFQSGHEVPVFPQAVPIATQLPHAVGLGMAARHRGDDHAILTLFGDGATSEGDFHEAMNFAGVFDAPVVFCCENNGWAMSLPRERQTASETIAQKATAYGFEGVRVDGMDPIAVAETVADALATAHDTGPVLIESLTYRLGAHTTSDDPSRYRDDEGDLPEWRTTDPLERYETYLREQGLLDDGTANEIHADAEAAVEAAVERVEAMPEPEPGEVFDPIYERLPAELQRQRSAVVSAADTGEQ